MGTLFLAVSEEERFLERQMTPAELEAFTNDRIAYSKGRSPEKEVADWFDKQFDDAKRNYERQFDDFLSDLKNNNSPNKADHE